MKCQVCQSELNPGSTFCTNCGTPVPSNQYGSPASPSSPNQGIPPTMLASSTPPPDPYATPYNSPGAPANPYGAPASPYGMPSTNYGANSAPPPPGSPYGAPPTAPYGTPGAPGAYGAPGSYGQPQ